MSDRELAGTLLPDLRSAIPGPRSTELARRLARVESRNITGPGAIFWAEARGANVRDADDNVFIDLTAGFGVAAAGHANPEVAAAAASQLKRLAHALGDVHPAAVKVELLERLASLAPGDLSVGILSANGSDAVESALKTAVLATGRPGVVAFEGGYHGLGYGALSVTAAARFRAPFLRQLYAGARFAPFPAAGNAGATTAQALESVREQVLAGRSGSDPVGAVIVEPIQGRGGVVVPPSDFLPGLRSLCDELEILLVVDEIYTGLGRTGRWFACEHGSVVPDMIVVGKALGGGLPLSAVLGAPAVMESWPASTGEAIHTSTFLGNPVACAAALAQLQQIEALGLVERAERLGAALANRLDALVASGHLRAARGLGLMRAGVLAGRSAAARARWVATRALHRGIIVLAEDDALAITPPLVISDEQLAHAMSVVEAILHEG